MIKNLTNQEFERALLEAKFSNKNRTRINLGSNLFISVSANSDKVPFSVRVKNNKSDTMIVIGYYPTMTLPQARVKAKDTIKSFKAKKEAEEDTIFAPTLREAFDEWYQVKITQYKPGSTRPKNLRTIMRTTIAPSGLADLKINEITPKSISSKLSFFKQTPGNKHNAISTISSCLQFFYLKGQLPFNPIADLLKGRESPFKKPKAKGFKYIDANELYTKFLKPLAVTPKVNRVFYLYLILTGFRFGEARLALWAWFDFDKELIVIPADAIGANKTQTEYVKPMTSQIKTLMINWKKSQEDLDNDYVFKSEFTDKAICEGSFREPIKALTTRELDLHGIRKVIRSWFSSQNISVKISELALQHDVRSSLEKVYDKYAYTEEIRDALQQWNDFVETQLPDEFLELLKE